MRPTVTDSLGDLATATEELSVLRWRLGQVSTLAEQAPGLTDAQLRARLVALTDQLTGDQS